MWMPLLFVSFDEKEIICIKIVTKVFSMVLLVKGSFSGLISVHCKEVPLYTCGHLGANNSCQWINLSSQICAGWHYIQYVFDMLKIHVWRVSKVFGGHFGVLVLVCLCCDNISHTSFLLSHLSYCGIMRVIRLMIIFVVIYAPIFCCKCNSVCTLVKY